MKLFACTDHAAHWNVGCASVVLADDEDQARALLDAELQKHGLKGHDGSAYTLRELSASEPVAHVLWDGNY